MNRIIIITICVAAALSAQVMAQTVKDKAPKGASAGVAAKTAVTQPAAGVMPPKSNFGIISGTVVRIDSSDQSNIKLVIKDDADGKERSIAIAPWTPVTKVTAVSELKQGNPVRVMIRKADGKDTAMSVVFGDIKKAPLRRTASETVKPENAKK